MALTPETYFAAGATLASMVNLELTLLDPFQVLEYGRIPLLAPIKSRSLDSFPRRDGKINARLLCDVATDAGRKALNTLLFGNQTTAGAELYVSAIDEDGYYSPFLAIVERPVEVDEYRVAVGGEYVAALILPLANCRVQSVTKTSNYSRTTSDHLIYFDTTSGSITDALPAVATVNTYVIFSAVKSASANSLIINPSGAELIQNAATLTLTALNARSDFYTDGVSWFTI